ncbi:MAG: hypothetical protein M3P32_04625, partial [Chloroflexota bacterium]|nr:hypothetical protein [Chloroflexota bacterium]
IFYGWIRAKVELRILGNPRLDAAPIGVIGAGELISASEVSGYPGDEGWLLVDLANQSGWVATRQDGADLVERFAPPPSAVSGAIWNLAGGPNGFVGIGSASGTSAEWPGATLIHSADGASWETARDVLAPGLYPTGVAWGPEGWLLVSSGWDGGSWFSTSPDGVHWTVAGTLRTPGGNVHPIGLVASDAGYLFSTDSPRFSPGRTLWFSEDGVNWHEVNPGLSSTSYLIAGMSGGFYAWADPDCCEPQAAFSLDGLNWSPVAGGPQGFGLQLAALGDRWYAIETDRATGVPRAWVGRVNLGHLSWQRMSRSVAPFDNAAVTSLVSTGDEVIAFGWHRASETALTWTTIGSDWSRSELPASFGGIPRVTAAGRAGVVLVGQRPSTVGDNPIVWHRTPSGAWLPEPDPLIEAVPEPSAADCAPSPHDGLAFANLDRALAPFCYGDAAMTFRSWSGRCEGCWGAGEGTYEPEWLAAPVDNQLVLSPVESENAWTAAVLSPSLAARPADEWLEAWLEVTGHFDDPLATICRFTPVPQALVYYPGAFWGVNTCRQQFVVTAVRVVDGP